MFSENAPRLELLHSQVDEVDNFVEPGGQCLFVIVCIIGAGMIMIWFVPSDTSLIHEKRPKKLREELLTSEPQVIFFYHQQEKKTSLDVGGKLCADPAAAVRAGSLTELTCSGCCVEICQ